jgi:hypothetical protein
MGVSRGLVVGKVVFDRMRGPETQDATCVFLDQERCIAAISVPEVAGFEEAP